MSAILRPRSPHRHQGFTLFEVALSLGLVAFGVISVLMVFPAGLKAQQLSRYQILASVRAMEMVDIFSSATDASLQVDREGPHPWDTTTSYHAFAPDLETRIGSFRYGLFPLPLDIARRLDSDDNEIQQVLADGGYVYYSQPSATSGFNPVGARANLPSPNESQKILCAVTGYAQQNAIPSLSYKDWPYHAPYPSPPMHICDSDTSTSKPSTPWSVIDTARSDKFMLWEDTLDADHGDMAMVFQAIVKGTDLPKTTIWVDSGTLGGVLVGKFNHLGKPFYRSSGYWAYGDQGGWVPEFSPGDSNLKVTPPTLQWRQNHGDGGKRNNRSPYDIQPAKIPHFSNVATPGSNPPVYPKIGDLDNPLVGTTQKALARESAVAYFALAKWYASRKQVSAAISDGTPLVDNGDLLKPSTLFQGSSGNPALAINAARLLAHAAMCMTSHFLPDGASDQDFTIGELDVIREGGSFPYAGKSPSFRLNGQVIKTYVENAMKLGMRFAACHPYDWGVPRPLNRATMMDFPLMQYDPFCDTTIKPSQLSFSGYLYGARAGKPPEQWKIITAQPIANIGRSICYPSMNLAALWPSVTSSTPEHFTLARKFEAADRCRQIVFWAVDWQAYEDFETAPSAPVDASRYPKRSPHATNLSGNAASPDSQRTNASFADRHQFCYRNPEKFLVFLEPTTGKTTGDDNIQIAGNDSMGFFDQFKTPAVNGNPDPVKVFAGMYGADRNFNGTRTALDVGNSDVNRRGDIIKIYGKLDRGPVPKSVRMRATLVGRFNFYDPRVPLVIR